MEVAFSDVLHVKGRPVYIDVSVSRLYIIFGGTIISVPYEGTGRDSTKFGYRLRDKQACSAVITQIESRFGCSGNVLNPDNIFSDDLGLASGNDSKDLLGSMKIIVRGSVLSKALIGFTTEDPLEILFGHVNVEKKKLILHTEPILTNSRTRFIYRVTKNTLTITQAFLTCLPPILESCVQNISIPKAYKNDRPGNRTDISVLGKQSISVMSTPRNCNSKGSSQTKHVTISEHVQVQTIDARNGASKNDRSQQQMVTDKDDDALEGPSRPRNGEITVMDQNLTKTGTVLERMYFVCNHIDNALTSNRNQLKNTLSLEAFRSTGYEVLFKRIAMVCSIPGPGQEKINALKNYVSPAQRYVIIQAILETASLPNDLATMEIMCEKYRLALQNKKISYRSESSSENYYVDIGNCIILDIVSFFIIIESCCDVKMPVLTHERAPEHLKKEANAIIKYVLNSMFALEPNRIGKRVSPVLMQFIQENVTNHMRTLYTGQPACRTRALLEAQTRLSDSRLLGVMALLERTVVAFEIPTGIGNSKPWEILALLLSQKLKPS